MEIASIDIRIKDTDMFKEIVELLKTFYEDERINIDIRNEFKGKLFCICERYELPNKKINK
jgi:hypothetical protein